MQAAVYETFNDIALLPWVGVGFPMASVAVILLYGRLFGLFNIKLLICISVIVFEVGSALCGAAPTMNALIVGRAIAGVGGCGLYIGYVCNVFSSRVSVVLTEIEVHSHTCQSLALVRSCRSTMLPWAWLGVLEQSWAP